ncbi:paraquat-inducible protein A [Telmatospirillum siberiense]|uniref:paraquat-inducible protein A n=1 Tax=Telmatospirillum siberiense TaxID=382514 RepID=UPI001F533688|nr:paraquat-inducible protein A [Telmatospirillum siberiense]
MTVMSARDAGLVACTHCGLLCRDAAEETGIRCPRCRAELHPRKPDSLSRSCAYLMAAAILYIPANMLPVMETSSMFGAEKDTILSGIVYFWTSGSQGLAALIFFVSILVPMLKLGSLSVLAWTVRRRSVYNRRQRAVLFRIIEMVGRWSMLDVFVVALMVGLVHFQGLAVIQAGSGAAAFGAVVVLTMLAARSFDPRLIWDPPVSKENHD